MGEEAGEEEGNSRVTADMYVGRRARAGQQMGVTGYFGRE